MTQGIGLVALLWLWLGSTDIALKRLFSLLIASLLLISIAPYLENSKESNINIAIALLLIAFFWLPVIYWRLIHYLTTTVSNQNQWGTKHNIFPGLVTILAGWLMLLPEERSRALFVLEDAHLSISETILLVSVFLLFLGWLFFSLYYVVKITQRLVWYRRQLPKLFSNFTGKDLRWVDWQGGLLLLAWVTVALGYSDVFGQTRFLSLLTGSLLLMLLLLVIAIWGISQSPAFASITSLQVPLQALITKDAAAPGEDEDKTRRYQNSALTEKDIEVYKHKLLEQMERDIYLDPELSMPKLARSAGVPANYVSQTINEAFNCNFYQLINAYRIRFAQKVLRESNDNILNVALASGFNTRSAFYNAFKQNTGLTPSQYRLKQQSDQAKTQ
ncbi:AraC family transcriptional regulator [Planctobacterium marinum]